MSDRHRTFAAAVGLLVAACTDSPTRPSDEPASFSSTVSFGFCAPASYCASRLDLSEREATLTFESRERRPVVRTRPLPGADWAALVSALQPARLRALPAVIGCPDCADGGAESLTVAFADGQATTVTFEHGDDVAGIEALVERVRAIRRSFGPPPEDAAATEAR